MGVIVAAASLSLQKTFVAAASLSIQNNICGIKINEFRQIFLGK